MPANIADFLKNLPKTETRISIEGSVPWSLIKKAAPKKYAIPPASWTQGYRYSSYTEFEQTLSEINKAYFTSPERYHEAANEIFKEKEQQNVRYIEVGIDVANLKEAGLDGRAVASAIRAATPVNVAVRIFLDLERSVDIENMEDYLDDSLIWPHLNGYIFNGNDLRIEQDWAKRFIEKGHDHGKFFKAIAGEVDGPESIIPIIEEFSINRIVHGITAIEDPEVVRFLIDNEIALDMSPIANVKLNVIRTLAEHPIRPLYDQGVTCLVSTDRSFCFGNSLMDEYAGLIQELDFNCGEIADLVKRAFQVALLDDKRRNSIIKEIDSLKSSAMKENAGK